MLYIKEIWSHSRQDLFINWRSKWIRSLGIIAKSFFSKDLWDVIQHSGEIFSRRGSFNKNCLNWLFHILIIKINIFLIYNLGWNSGFWLGNNSTRYEFRKFVQHWSLTRENISQKLGITDWYKINRFLFFIKLFYTSKSLNLFLCYQIACLDFQLVIF